ncbi:MAG: hypothetical protein ISS26_04725 [Candidatus Omnitrophica bacterium]|nr:hypothetical protein [Candidatus Omnitrophota bacterium]
MAIKRMISLSVLSLACIIYPLSCLAQEVPVDTVDASPEDVTKLIEEAKGYVEEGDKEGAIMTLDLAYNLASSLDDYDMLMEIGDLYIRVDTSFKDKAMEAWTEAGRCKTKE